MTQHPYSQRCKPLSSATFTLYGNKMAGAWNAPPQAALDVLCCDMGTNHPLVHFAAAMARPLHVQPWIGFHYRLVVCLGQVLSEQVCSVA